MGNKKKEVKKIKSQLCETEEKIVEKGIFDVEFRSVDRTNLFNEQPNPS